MPQSDTRDFHEASVNRAIDYINAHLSERITLDDLAAQGCFSPFHFHRVFRAIVGETHQKYINRLRLERAALLMDGTRSLTEIAGAVGFSTQAHFTQAFKAHFGSSPRSWRSGGAAPIRKNSIVSRDDGSHTDGDDEKKMPFEIREFPAYRIAYARNVGGYDLRIGFAWARLMRWARKAGAIGDETLRISYSWDDPYLTEDGRLRYDACVTVPEWAAPEPPLGTRTIPGGRYAVFRYEGTNEGLGAFYDRVYAALLAKPRIRIGTEPGFRVHRETATEQIAGRCKNELRIPLEDR